MWGGVLRRDHFFEWDHFDEAAVPLRAPLSSLELCRGTSLIRNRPPPRTLQKQMPRVLGGVWGRGQFLMSEEQWGHFRKRRDYRGTSLIRKRPPPLGPYSSICLESYGGPRGLGVFS